MKKKLNKSISDVNIDRMYNTAKTADALGGKLMDAGGGEFMLFLVNPDQRDKVIIVMKEYRLEEFKIESFGSKTVYLGDY
ncbi:MAG: hypothetical protein QW046_04155 [Candidatus Micrarchaeaceae archaeon]|nr:hypothetical protein [Candidatus Rehaiarchaeum fermentans]